MSNIEDDDEEDGYNDDVIGYKNLLYPKKGEEFFNINVGEYEDEKDREFFVVFDDEEIPITYLKKYEDEDEDEDKDKDKGDAEDFNYEYYVYWKNMAIDTPLFIEKEGVVIRLSVNFKIGLYPDTSEEDDTYILEFPVYAYTYNNFKESEGYKGKKFQQPDTYTPINKIVDGYNFREILGYYTIKTKKDEEILSLINDKDEPDKELIEVMEDYLSRTIYRDLKTIKIKTGEAMTREQAEIINNKFISKIRWVQGDFYNDWLIAVGKLTPKGEKKWKGGIPFPKGSTPKPTIPVVSEYDKGVIRYKELTATYKTKKAEYEAGKTKELKKELEQLKNDLQSLLLQLKELKNEAEKQVSMGAEEEQTKQNIIDVKKQKEKDKEDEKRRLYQEEQYKIYQENEKIYKENALAKKEEVPAKGTNEVVPALEVVKKADAPAKGTNESKEKKLVIKSVDIKSLSTLSLTELRSVYNASVVEYKKAKEEYTIAEDALNKAQESGHPVQIALNGNALTSSQEKIRKARDNAKKIKKLYDETKEKVGSGLSEGTLLKQADNITVYDEINKYSNPKKVQEKAKKYLGEGAIIYRSAKKDKKYMIYNPNTKKWVHFGQIPYEDFTKHQDPKRRENYLKRTANMRGNWKNDKYSANNLSREILW